MSASVPTICQRCGREWTPNSVKPYVTCPRCDTKVKVGNRGLRLKVGAWVLIGGVEFQVVAGRISDSGLLWTVADRSGVERLIYTEEIDEVIDVD